MDWQSAWQSFWTLLGVRRKRPPGPTRRLGTLAARVEDVARTLDRQAEAALEESRGAASEYRRAHLEGEAMARRLDAARLRHELADHERELAARPPTWACERARALGEEITRIGERIDGIV